MSSSSRVVLALRACTLREWRAADAESLVRHANDPLVACNLRDRFPHPYTEADAERWLSRTLAAHPVTDLAIEVEGAAVGAIGLMPQGDVFRRTAEIGYWLGRAYWGRGLATDALRAATEWAFDCFDLCRLEAGVFDSNPASRRVLEKAGYSCESVRRKAVTKDGRTMDEHVYVVLR